MDKLLARYEKKAEGIIHISEIADDIEEAFSKWGKVDGISTGISTLDQQMGGMRKGEVILVAGDPNNGKSAVAANIAVNVSRKQQVLFISLEMLPAAIGARMRYINNGTIDGLDITFQASKDLSFKELSPLFEQGVRKGTAELVVIDYLQYLGRGMKNEEVALMSQTIKRLAREYEVPVMVVVSLRKDSQSKGTRRKWTEIEMDDLMGTGSIGYDADVVLLVSRKDPDMEWDNEYVYVRTIKIRSYPLDYQNNIAKLHWDKTKITEEIEDNLIISDPSKEYIQELFGK